MIRGRDESMWPTTSYSSVDDFLGSSPRSGAHAIWLGGLYLDLLVEDRGARATLVVFHGAVNERQPTLPVFQGKAVAQAAGLNLITVSDPSLAMGDVDLAWFLGNRWIGPLRPLLVPVIKHVLAAMGSQETILLGGSGGGYAAIRFAHDFPDSLVLALNPRLNLGVRPRAQVDQYLRACHKVTGPTASSRIRREFVPDMAIEGPYEELAFYLLIWQNTGDAIYMEHQLSPVLQRAGVSSRIFVRFDSFGRGHRPVPSEEVKRVCTLLGGEGEALQRIERAGFQPAAAISG